MCSGAALVGQECEDRREDHNEENEREKVRERSTREGQKCSVGFVKGLIYVLTFCGAEVWEI